MYKLKDEDIQSFICSMGAEVKEKGKEIHFKHCLYCQGGKSGDKYTLSINRENGAFKCLRASCGKSGHFVQLANDFNFKLQDEEKERKYITFKNREIVSTPKAIEYLHKRGISPDVIKRYKVTTAKDRSDVLMFPFFSAQNDRIEFIKYRNTSKDASVKEWAERDMKPILYGMQACEEGDTIVVTEGQIDALSVATAGIKNVVSVPNGAKGFTWVKHCGEWLSKYKTIIIFGDCENGKISLVEEMKKHFPKNLIKVVRVRDYLYLKDANEILTNHGTNAIIECIERAELTPLKSVKNMSEIEFGCQTAKAHIKTGFKQLDKSIGGFYEGQLVILSGKSGNGKSTFLSQIMANMVEQKKEVFLYSGELTSEFCKYWAWLQIAGHNNIIKVKEGEEEHYTLDYYTVKAIDMWAKDMLYLYDCESLEGDECEGLLEVLEQSIVRYNIKVALIDNLMTALDESMSTDLFTTQTTFVKRLKDIAKRYNIVVVLVAHPKKSKEDFDNESIAGSSNIGNLSDLILALERTTPEEDFDTRLMVTKNRIRGKILDRENCIELMFDETSKRFREYGELKVTEYSWKKYENFQQLEVVPF